VSLVLEKIGYPKYTSNALLEGIVKAIKNTSHSEKNRVIRRVFEKDMLINDGKRLAEKIGTLEAWKRFIQAKGSILNSNDLMKIGSQFNESSLWINIVRHSCNLKIEQIKHILNKDCFTNNSYDKRLLLNDILIKYLYGRPLFCVDVFIDFMDLLSKQDLITSHSREIERCKEVIFENVDLCDLGLDQLVRLYFRVREKIVLEALFLKCVSFSKEDLSGLLQNGHEKTKDFILSHFKI
jgi:hypothetical protein